MIKMFNVALINLCTEVEGPGKRLAIWFQGCDMFCKGCCNPEFQSLEVRHLLSLDKLCEIIEDSKNQNGIEGVTYLGGEPTLQINLSSLSKKISEMGLGVILFTGKKIEELKEEMLSFVDLVVDGPYEEDLDDERNLIGSRNQSLIHITNRYRENEDWFYKPRVKIVEVNVSPTELIFTGDVV